MPVPEATRCCICRDERRYGPLKDRVYIEPTSGSDLTEKYIRGWMCEECAVVHWAWDVDINPENAQDSQ